MAPDWVRHAIREAVFGAEDGLVSTFGALTGIAVGTESGPVVVISGFVIVAVESLSMAAGAYLSSKSNRQYLERLLKEEREQIERDPEGERREIRQMYQSRGYNDEEISMMERRLMSDKELLLEDMAHKELGISPAMLEKPAGNAVIMGLAYLIGGLAPTSPYLIWDIPPAMGVSMLVSAAALFAVGGIKGVLVRDSWWKSGFEMLVIGALAGGMGFVVGQAAGLLRGLK